MYTCEEKNAITEFFNYFFVENFKDIEYLINQINEEFQQNNIQFRFTYDCYCKDFLNELDVSLRIYYIFNAETEDELTENISQLGLIIREKIIEKRVIASGCDWKTFKRKEEYTMISQSYS